MIFKNTAFIIKIKICFRVRWKSLNNIRTISGISVSNKKSFIEERGKGFERFERGYIMGSVFRCYFTISYRQRTASSQRSSGLQSTLVTIAWLHRDLLLCNRVFFLFHCHFDNMMRIYKRLFKSKKPSLDSIHVSGPATFASTNTGTTDPMPSILACDSESDETRSAQVAAGASVRIQPRPLYLKVLTYCYQADRP